MINVRDLLVGVRIANPDGTPTPEFIEVMQRLTEAAREGQDTFAELADVSAPAGGSTVDTEARAAISAMIAAADQ